MNKNQERLISESVLVMLRRLPYFGTFVIGMPRLPDESIPTACTNGTDIRYNPKWLLGGHDSEPLRPREEVVFVLAHEVLHCSFKHMLRQGYRDPALWNVACLHGDTLVTLQSRAMVKIKDLKGGSVIRSPLGPNTIHMVTRACRSDMVEVGVENRHNIKATNDHLFLTKEGFIEARHLQVGQEVLVETKGWLGGHHSSSEEDGRVGVHGGDRGRGGYDINWSRSGEESPVLSTAYLYLDHLSGAGRVGRGDGFVRHAGEELERARILESYGFRLGDRSVSSWDAALFADQETARRVAADLHRSAPQAAKDLCSFAGDDLPLLADQGFERARITHLRPYVEETEVYDLVTEHHSYVANGVVVHNCDYAINLILAEGEVGAMPKNKPDPKTGITPPSLLDARFKDMSAETIYDILEKERQKQGGGQKIKMPNGAVIDLSNPDPGGTGGFERPVNADGSGLSDAQKAELERDLDGRTSSSAAAAKAQGKLPAGMERFLMRAMAPIIDWRDRLRQFVFKQFPADYSWARPNRRHSWNDLYLPHVTKDGVGEILVIMDTSGSVNYGGPETEGAQYWAEIASIHADVMPSKLHVMYCDAEVAGYDVFDQGEEIVLKPRGGGGTDFRPPFKRIAKDDIADIQCAIYLTDGYGTFPEKPMPYPVMWVITTDVVAPWGETVSLKK